MSVDGTPISQADMARIHAEEQLHAQQQRSAVKVVAASATDVEDCRMLLSILGLGPDATAAAHAELSSAKAVAAPVPAPAAKRARKRRVAA